MWISKLQVKSKIPLKQKSLKARSVLYKLHLLSIVNNSIYKNIASHLCILSLRDLPSSLILSQFCYSYCTCHFKHFNLIILILIYKKEYILLSFLNNVPEKWREM